METTLTEQHEVLAVFMELLRGPTGDGKKKRDAGTKPSWKVDPAHEAALFSHLFKWKKGETVDPDSGAHPLVHLAWRALAIAWQETNQREEKVPAPESRLPLVWECWDDCKC